MSVERVVAVDWSGDKGPGQRKKIWAGVWTADDGGGVYGGRVGLESGRTRVEVGEWLIEMAKETPRMVVGVDFCFSYPAWFVEELGAGSVVDLWEIVTTKGEHWLSHECADARFWGRKGLLRDGKKPTEFSGERGDRMFRQADLACKVQDHILNACESAKVKGIAPKSPFQIGGAGAVGTGTLRGIPHLLHLRGAGFSVWPFDIPALPLLVEIYPRLMTGAVNKSRIEARTKYLSDKRSTDLTYRNLEERILAKAQVSEDAFDALVSAMGMARERTSFLELQQPDDRTTLLEGLVWPVIR